MIPRCGARPGGASRAVHDSARPEGFSLTELIIIITILITIIIAILQLLINVYMV